MKWFESEEASTRAMRVALAAGATGALAAGIVAIRRRGGVRRIAADLREGAARAAEGVSPARLRREGVAERALTNLEDAVIDSFLEDVILSKRGIDVGAVGEGIIELSGSVHEESEAQHAVRIAQTVDDVVTVVNRLEIEPPVPRRSSFAQTEARGRSNGQWNGRNIGMGRMRQDPATEPDRRDDAQKIRSRALAEADRNEALSVSPDRLDQENSGGANQSLGSEPDEESVSSRGSGTVSREE